MVCDKQALVSSSWMYTVETTLDSSQSEANNKLGRLANLWVLVQQRTQQMLTDTALFRTAFHCDKY